MAIARLIPISNVLLPAQVHFIFRHKNPITGEFEEKHLKTPPKPKIEKLTNLYTLIVKFVHSIPTMPM